MLAAVLAASSFAQQPARFASVIGSVEKIDDGAHVLTVNADKTGETSVKFDDKTAFQRLAPGETDMRKATPAKLSDLSTGDRVLVRVRTEDPTGLPASSVYIMKQADIAQRQKKTDEEWRTQSVGGVVKSADAKQVVILVTGKEVTIDVSAAGDVQQFDPDKLSYQPGPVSGIRAGDQLRVLGEKNADGSQIKAEGLRFGTFRTIPVMVKSVDAAGSISGQDLGTKKPIVIAVKSGTPIKRLDDQTAAMLARRLNPTLQGAGRGRGAGDAPAGAPPAAGGRGGRGGPGGAFDLNRVLDAQPAIQLGDVKPNEPLVVMTAAVGDKLTATEVVAGVDPILRAAPQNGPDPLGGSWNLGDGGGGGAQ